MLYIWTSHYINGIVLNILTFLQFIFLPLDVSKSYTIDLRGPFEFTLFFENCRQGKDSLLFPLNCMKPLYLPRDGNGLGVQRVEHPGSQTVSSIFGQPALASKDIFDPLGWHGNRQLINQPAALWSGPIVAQLEAVGGKLTGCVCMREYVSMWASSLCLTPQTNPSQPLTSTFLISPTSEPRDSKVSNEPASKPWLPSARSSHSLSVWVWLAPIMITYALLVVLASRSRPVQMVMWYGITAQTE